MDTPTKKHPTHTVGGDGRGGEIEVGEVDQMRCKQCWFKQCFPIQKFSGMQGNYSPCQDGFISNMVITEDTTLTRIFIILIGY